MKKYLFVLFNLISCLTTVCQTIPTAFNNSISTCGATVYDMGGSTAGLESNADGSLTIYPATAGSVVAVYIEELDIDFYSDYLYIYNGASISSPLLGTFQGFIGGTMSQDKREYYGTSGAITIRLKTGPYASKSDKGCIIKVRCAPTSQPNNMIRNKMRYVNSCNTTIYDQGGLYGDYENNSSDTIRILPDAPGKRVQIAFEQVAINNLSSQDQLVFTYGLKESATTSLYAMAGYRVPDNPVSLSSGSTDGSVEFTLLSNSSGTAQGFRAKVTCIADAKVPALTETVIPATGSATIGCGTKVWDNGHKYNYFPNTNGTITIQPLAGKKAQIDFSEFDLGIGDAITVFDGPTTSSSVLNTLTGNTLPPTIIASESNPNGTLTVRFVSNASVEGKGFVFNSSCPTVLGINEDNEYSKNDIKLYPNPALDKITLEGSEEGSVVTVFDSKGILMFKKVLNERIETISTAMWGQGLYSFSIEKGKEIKTYQISVLK